MIMILEIVAVVAAFVVLASGATVLGKNARAFGRSAKRTEVRITPKVDAITVQADTARELGFRVSDRTQQLQERGIVLTDTMNKMRVLAAAAARSRQELKHITGYIGL